MNHVWRPAVGLIAVLLLAGTRPAAAQRDVTLDTGTGIVAGTRLDPSGPGPHPGIVIIAGSGPTDRDGNSAGLAGPNNSLRLLAEALTAAGFTTVRYDKRGIAASAAAAGAEADLRIETYADDAAHWVRQMRADPQVCTVTIVGHSEGALIGTLAAERAAADAVVLLAGPARPAGALIREQLAPRLDAATYARADAIVTRLEAGRAADSVPPMLWPLFRPSVQPYLISWFSHDPAAAAARTTTPVLAVFGTTDVQVPASDTLVLQRAAPRARLLVIPGMNHVLKTVGDDPAAQLQSYSDPALPLAPGLVEGIARFAHAAAACPAPGSRRAPPSQEN